MTDWYRMAWPGLRLLPPEKAHGLAMAALNAGLVPAAPANRHAALEIRVWDRAFPNPLGLAAGFDKNAEVFAALLRMGFGFVEVGTVTPKPQAGNPKPRMFRLEPDQALINRLGFNNGGLIAVVNRLARRGQGIVGANIGMNRDAANPIDDYLRGFTATFDRADYVVVNVSSPNTPGLRDLQGRDALMELLATLIDARAQITPAGFRFTPLVVKIAPDHDDAGKADIAAVALATGIDGMIIGNTTLSRGGLISDHRDEAGGLSGRPLFARSTALLRHMYRLTEGRIPLIGAGGVASGADAYGKIRAGASLVQLYTALVYHGPGLVARINDELAALLKADGIATIADAVGLDA
jgi:dihydroorotate dehydrogenase